MVVVVEVCFIFVFGLILSVGYNLDIWGIILEVIGVFLDLFVCVFCVFCEVVYINFVFGVFYVLNLVFIRRIIFFRVIFIFNIVEVGNLNEKCGIYIFLLLFFVFF